MAYVYPDLFPRVDEQRPANKRIKMAQQLSRKVKKISKKGRWLRGLEKTKVRSS
jgi:hypothetical protein